MKTLKELCKFYKKDSWPDKDSPHSYIEVYEEVLEPYRTQAKKILEIGIFSGQSLRMWEEYFSGKVYGADCSDQPLGMMDLRPMIKEGTHNIVIMDATDSLQVERHFKDIKFDVIIDDASHLLDHQVRSYNIFKNYLSPKGIYIIEDIQDIDQNRLIFETIDPDKTIEILDRRSIKNRYDDVLVIIR